MRLSQIKGWLAADISTGPLGEAILWDNVDGRSKWQCVAPKPQQRIARYVQ